MKKAAIMAALLTLSLLIGGFACAQPAGGSQQSEPVSEIASETVSESTAQTEVYGRYMGVKGPKLSGIFAYTSGEPFRIYPSADAPYTYPPEETAGEVIVQVYGTVSAGGELWCSVVDDNGRCGFVLPAALRLLSAEEDDPADYACGETLGGFTLGERIETLIGTLDTEYQLAYENGRIYLFYEPGTVNADFNGLPKPEMVGAGVGLLDAFCDQYNRVTLLRTDNPAVKLSGGYAVGDNMKKAVAYYTEKYGAPQAFDSYNGNGSFRFLLGGAWEDTTKPYVILELRTDDSKVGEDQALDDSLTIEHIYLYRLNRG